MTINKHTPPVNRVAPRINADTSKFYFSMKFNLLVIILLLCLGLSIWMSVGIYSPETKALWFSSDRILSNPKILFWHSLVGFICALVTGGYLLATIEHKLVLDVNNCTLTISYAFLKKETIQFESINSLLVFQDSEDLVTFGIQCCDKNQLKDKYLSLGLCWRLDEKQLTSFIAVIKQYHLDEGECPWD